MQGSAFIGSIACGPIAKRKGFTSTSTNGAARMKYAWQLAITSGNDPKRTWRWNCASSRLQPLGKLRLAGNAPVSGQFVDETGERPSQVDTVVHLARA